MEIKTFLSLTVTKKQVKKEIDMFHMLMIF